MLNRDQILGADDRKTEIVKVPEWGGDVTVKGLSGKQRDAFESGCVVRKGKKVEQNLANIRARLCVLCIVDEDGKRILNDKDISLLGDKSGSALDRVYDVASKLSGLSAEDVDELAKN